MDMAEQLYQLGRDLPPESLAELIDFAEFLCLKQRGIHNAQVSLQALAGGLEHSPRFANSAMHIQEELRREWD